jgi:CheY-like chemotaxis protein
MRRVMQYRAAPIVLVEDDPNDARFVRRALDQAHIVNPLLRFATTGEVRRHFDETATFAIPALFVIDVRLPGGETGLDLLRWLRQQPLPLGSTPTMMLSGSRRSADHDEAELLGSMLYLHKPVTEEALTAAVQSLGFVISSLTGLSIERTIERRA